MLTVTKCGNRPVECGQYLISLIDVRHDNPELSSRVSYYCDKAHLSHCLFGIMAMFRDDLDAAVKVDWAKFQRELSTREER